MKPSVVLSRPTAAMALFSNANFNPEEVPVPLSSANEITCAARDIGMSDTEPNKLVLLN
jgi:hypothetical protein